MGSLLLQAYKISKTSTFGYQLYAIQGRILEGIDIGLVTYLETRLCKMCTLRIMSMYQMVIQLIKNDYFIRAMH
jgi:hypothetical protein